jgi:hypothetical protein
VTKGLREIPFPKFSFAALIAAATFFLTLCPDGTVHALNGFTYVAGCTSCKTSSDFVAQAAIVAKAERTSGTYTVVSFANPETAYVKVTGILGINGEDRQVFIITSAVPVDSSGNSLAGESEASQEAFFGTLDSTIFGVNRGNPISVNEPYVYASSFVNSDDAEVGPGIDQALLDKGILWSSLPDGTVITVVFTDGTSAQFYLENNSSSDHWIWNGTAHNQQGQPINRNGIVLSNPNSSGGGGGDVSAPPIGGDLTYFIGGKPQCRYSVTLDWPTGSATTSYGWGPC